MPLVSLEIPPGIYRHGTDLDAKNRWHDSNLVRWKNNSLRPIGGWESYVDSNGTAIQISDGTGTQTIARGAVSWVTNSNEIYLAVGTYNKLFAIQANGTVLDITPAGLTSGLIDAGENLGYGGKSYGYGTYGTGRTSDGSTVGATVWTLDNWGEYLVGCSTADGAIYEWQLGAGSPASVIANAPTGNQAIVVTAERFLFALGASGNPRKVSWCDKEDNTVWSPLATNEAGDIELATNGRILAGARVRGRTLILTSTDAHIAIYNGPPTVYGFERVGTGCGLISPQAVASIDDGAFWMGANAFYVYDGSTATEIKCDVLDHVFDDINRSQVNKVWSVSNQKSGEVWWFYPSASSNEPNRYAAYDYKRGYWLIGEITRTAGVDAGVYSYPVWIENTGYLYYHERGLSHGGVSPFAETGPIMIESGGNVIKATNLIPDEETLGDVSLTFKTRFHPTDTEYTYGPFLTSNPTSVRFTGRQIRMRINGSDLKDWRVGSMRLDIQPGGKR